MKLVIKYGGSLLFDGNGIDTGLVDKICDKIRELHDEGHELGIVVGGGATARSYISSLDKGFGEANKDYVAVLATRLNAMLFISRLSGLCCPLPPSSYEEMVNYVATKRIVVSGGMQPGQSTNAVATLLCEAMGARELVNATNVDYIYDKDPSVHNDAKPIREMGYGALKDLISSIGSGAGRYDMFDMVAAKNIERSNIRLHFINGRDPENIGKVIGKKPVGTVVKGKI